MNARPAWAGALWMALPLAIYLFLLHRLSFNAPVWDDYEAMLDSPMMLMAASSPGQWLQALFMQHNEHRVAYARLVAWAMAQTTGKIDFPPLVLIGNLAWVGILALLWAEFRAAVAAPLFMAAAFVMLQLGYCEASLLAMAALSNFGVVMFAFACLFFAVRPRPADAALAVLFGMVAAGTQGNGLFALPIAAAAAFFMRRPGRGALFVAVAIALWVPYFWSYARPTNHAPMLLALERPLDVLQLFLVIVGGTVPGPWLPLPLAAAILLALGWLVRHGAWRAHPAAVLWTAFALASAAAAAVGRVGFGVFLAPRYGVYSAFFIAIVLLLLASRAQLRHRGAVLVLVLVAATVSALTSWAAWPVARDYAFRGRLLAEAVPVPPAAVSERYFGVLHPDPNKAVLILAEAGRHGLYRPPRVPVQPTRVVVADSLPPGPTGGSIDRVEVSGDRVILKGWSHIPASLAMRVLTLAPSAETPRQLRVVVHPSPDLAVMTHQAELLFSGFELEAAYASPGAAARAAPNLCLSAQSPGHARAVLLRIGGGCAE
jgi:hypothetical protein